MTNQTTYTSCNQQPHLITQLAIFAEMAQILNQTRVVVWIIGWWNKIEISGGNGPKMTYYYELWLPNASIVKLQPDLSLFEVFDNLFGRGLAYCLPIC